jgi:hypothetical protein
LLGAWSLPHIRAMASSPMRKLRKTGAVDQDGNVVTSPRLPSVTGAHKPPGWNRWSAAEKAEHLLGMSLDRMHDYLSWPADSLDPYRLAAQTQVVRVIAMVAAKVGEKLPASAIGNASSAGLSGRSSPRNTARGHSPFGGDSRTSPYSGKIRVPWAGCPKIGGPAQQPRTIFRK